jgi:predicted small secreted protein
MNFIEMKTRNTILSVLFLLAVSFILSSCTGKTGQGTDSGNLTAEESEQSKDQVLKEMTEYPLPTAFEVTTLLIKAGASYILDLSNPVGNVDKYINQKSKALNLGVYGADLSYAATYNQSQETMLFLKVTSQLVDELQISSGFDQTLVENVEKNIDNVDSLINIISDSFYSTYKLLKENHQDEVSILVMAGSWIEAIYITSQICLLSNNNAELVSIIAQQNPSLTKLMEIMEPAKESNMVKDIYTDLKKIKTLFDDAGETFTPKQLDQLAKEIDSLRNKIVA